MSRKVFSGTVLIFLMSLCFHVTINPYVFFASGFPEPSKLKVYVGPPKVSADNNVYEAVFVQLQDATDRPARAPKDMTIHLSSSQTHIGSVDPIVTIRSQATYAVAKFYSTYTPGSTIITATASGYPTTQASITTVGPVPSQLAVYSFPPTVPADGEFYDAIIVQLQDAKGLPAKAPIGNINVTLSSSNIIVGTVGPSMVIEAGNTYAVATFNATNAAGSTTITAIASGYISGQTTIRAQEISAAPSVLKVYIGPPKVPAEGVVFEPVAIQLQDSSGKIAMALGNLRVALSSSNTAVGTVDPSITIRDGKTYNVTNFYSTYRSGGTIITAAASGYITGQSSITTVGPIPSKLMVYSVPSYLPADGGFYDAVLVQLQDSDGTPAKDSVGDIKMDLFSSKPEVGNVSLTMIIPFGKTYSIARFFSTYTGGSTTITAMTPGYTSGQVTVTTYLIDMYPLSVSVTAYPTIINSIQQTTIRVYVTYHGHGPAPGATIKLTSNKGGSFSPITDERNGYYMSVFTAPAVTSKTVCTVSANASKSGYTSGHGNVEITVNPVVYTGNISLYVKETGGNPISGASVISTSQPSGISSLSGTTDEKGHVAFDNVLAGSYTIQVSKPDYDTKTMQINVTAAETTTETIYVSGGSLSLLGLSIPLLVAIVIISAILIGLAVKVVLRRRREQIT